MNLRRSGTMNLQRSGILNLRRSGIKNLRRSPYKRGREGTCKGIHNFCGESGLLEILCLLFRELSSRLEHSSILSSSLLLCSGIPSEFSDTPQHIDSMPCNRKTCCNHNWVRTQLTTVPNLFLHLQPDSCRYSVVSRVALCLWSENRVKKMLTNTWLFPSASYSHYIFPPTYFFPRHLANLFFS
jgi:hypothetical protein